MRKEYMTQLETQLAQLLTKSFPYLGDDSLRRRVHTYTKREVRHLVLAALGVMAYKKDEPNTLSPLYTFSQDVSDIQKENGLLATIQPSKKYPRTLLGWNILTASGENKDSWDTFSKGRLLLKDHSTWSPSTINAASPRGHTYAKEETFTKGTLTAISGEISRGLTANKILLRDFLPVAKVPINLVFQKQVHVLLNFIFDPYSEMRLKSSESTLWRPSAPSASYSLSCYGDYKISFDIEDRKWLLWEL
jgi:hypothetical protein